MVWGIEDFRTPLVEDANFDSWDARFTDNLVGRDELWYVFHVYSFSFSYICDTLASPYLISLGLSKSFMSVVFLAGPLSGLIVQPLIGMSEYGGSLCLLKLFTGSLSDRAHSRFGRRRPYILFGIVTSFAAMYLFGFTQTFANIFTTSGTSSVRIIHSPLPFIAIQ